MVIKDTTTHRTIVVPKWTEAAQFPVGSDSLTKKARGWFDAHYNTIMRIWSDSEDCKILGLQDQIGKFQRGLGKARAKSVLMYLTRKQYPNSPVPMTGFTPSSLVLTNDAKTRPGLSQLHNLINQRAFMLVCEPKKTTIAEVKNFVRGELEKIREKVKENESAIAALQDQAIWWWVLPLIALAVAVGAYFFPRRESESNQGGRDDRDPRRMVPPPPEGPNEPGGEDGPGNREAEAANAPNLTRREREYVEEDDRRELRVVEHFDGANVEGGNG